MIAPDSNNPSGIAQTPNESIAAMIGVGNWSKTPTRRSTNDTTTEISGADNNAERNDAQRSDASEPAITMMPTLHSATSTPTLCSTRSNFAAG